MTKEISFSDHEKRQLQDAGAFLYMPMGLTLADQINYRRPLEMVKDTYVFGAYYLVPRPIEVAVFPNDLVLTDSTYKGKKDQFRMLKEDEKSLSARLGLDIAEIFPNVAEVLEMVFAYQDRTGIKLINGEYGSMIRTGTTIKDPDRRFGHKSICVGRRGEDHDLYVYSWETERHWENLGVARWVVPGKARENLFSRWFSSNFNF